MSTQFRFPSRCFRLVALCCGLFAWLPSAVAHEIRPAYLEIKESAADRYDVLWRTPINAGMRLPVLLKFPAEVRNVAEPGQREVADSLVERREIEVPGGLAGKRIEFVGLQATITDVFVRVEMRDGRRATTIIHP